MAKLFDILEGLPALIVLIVIVVIIVRLLRNPSTRRVTCKVLLTIGGSILGFAAVAWLGSLVWGGNFILVAMAMVPVLMLCGGLAESLKWLVKAVRLHRNGIRIHGTMTDEGYKTFTLSYCVDGVNYQYTESYPMYKWKIGDNEIPMLYEPEHPEKACLVKYPIIASAACAAGIAPFAVGGIVLIFVLCSKL